MKMKITLVLVSLALLFMQHASVASEVSADILVSDSVSWDGGAFEYNAGEPEITIQKININTGTEMSLAMHCHTIPLAAYVSKGSVRVVKLSGESKLFQAGDAFIEVMNKWHKGVFVEDTELIAFYAGNKGKALSVKHDGDASQPDICK
ncbi:MAG: hypothetical protein GY784_10720 [Gammaproteobacteria bacterium]|nr:hypothetical protein [Gammaproteobacteria bacterium]